MNGSLRTRAAPRPKTASSSVTDTEASFAVPVSFALKVLVEGDSQVKSCEAEFSPLDDRTPWISDVKFKSRLIEAISLNIDPMIGPVRNLARMPLRDISIGMFPGTESERIGKV